MGDRDLCMDYNELGIILSVVWGLDDIVFIVFCSREVFGFRGGGGGFVYGFLLLFYVWEGCYEWRFDGVLDNRECVYEYSVYGYYEWGMGGFDWIRYYD